MCCGCQWQYLKCACFINFFFLFWFKTMLIERDRIIRSATVQFLPTVFCLQTELPYLQSQKSPLKPIMFFNILVNLNYQNLCILVHRDSVITWEKLRRSGKIIILIKKKTSTGDSARCPTDQTNRKYWLKVWFHTT